jgi:hypothetical protein
MSKRKSGHKKARKSGRKSAHRKSGRRRSGGHCRTRKGRFTKC